MIFFIGITLFLVQFFCGIQSATYVETIKYQVFDTDGSVKIWKAGNESFSSLNCPKSGNLSFIFTGWSENYNSTWVPVLINNLKTYRGGCIVLTDYWTYTFAVDYVVARSHYNGITAAVISQINTFHIAGFSPSNSFIFGFSLGGQIALGVGRGLANKIQRVDVCEPTAVGFPTTPNSTLSAVNVQCIHTSSDKGTPKRDCHQDWNMGKCGTSQVGAIAPPMGSHGLCPHFYNSAFQNDFVAIAKPKICTKPTPYTNTWPTGFKMGYMENRFTNTGQFFANTTASFPYN